MTLSSEAVENILDRLLGAKTALRACYEKSPKGNVIYKEKNKERMKRHFSAAESALFEHCFKQQKNEFVRSFLLPTIASHVSDDERCADYQQLGERLQNSLSLVVRMTTHIFTTQKLFDTFCRLVPKELVDALYRMSFDITQCNVADLEALLKVNIITYEGEKRGYRRQKNYITTFALFSFKNGLYEYSLGDYVQIISLPKSVRMLLRERFLHNLPPALQPLDGTPDVNFQYNAEEFIAANADIVVAYLQSGKIALTAGQMPLKTSLRQMAAICGIPEFFTKEHKGLNTLATELLLSFLEPFAKKNVGEDTRTILKQWLEYYRRGYFPIRLNLLRFLKVLRYDREFRTEKGFIELLRQFSDGVWYSAQSLMEYVRRNREAFSLVDEENFGKLFYISADAEYAEKYPNYRYRVLGGTDYNDVILTPLVKGSMFLFAALGLVEIAYTIPTNSTLQNGVKPYLSPFDGFSAVRITGLGKFLVGDGAAEYVSSKEAKPAKEFTILFDEQRLFLSLHADDKKRQMYMNDFAKPLPFAGVSTISTTKHDSSLKKHNVSSNADQAESLPRIYYKLTYQDFLADCSTRTDVEKKIELFRKNFVNDILLPKNWMQFFYDLVTKVEPLQKQPNLVMFSVKPSPELLHLLTHDPELRQIVHKAEGYHIFVRIADVATLKRRLRECGYLMPA